MHLWNNAQSHLVDEILNNNYKVKGMHYYGGATLGNKLFFWGVNFVLFWEQFLFDSL
jgi:hypothetical protein